jgi:hypothetical protein
LTIEPLTIESLGAWEEVAMNQWPARWLRIALLALSVLARPAGAEEFTGYGPLPVRNYQPIQLIFLGMPFERAQALRPGAFAVHLDSAESNEIATEQGGIEATLKFETNRTVLGGAVGVVPGFEVGLDVPMISRFGGFLDPFIDSVEDFFGTKNAERNLYPNNTFGGFTVQRGDTTLFHGYDQQFALGDIWASAKYEVWRAERWPLVSLRGAIKAPTGRSGSVFGSGKPDVGLGVATEYQTLKWLMLYGNVDLVYPVGPITPGDLTLNPIVTEQFAAEAYVGWNVSLLLQQHTYTSPMHGTGTPILDGTAVELAAGVNWMWPWQPVLFQLGFVDNVSGVATDADFTLLARLTYCHQPKR